METVASAAAAACSGGIQGSAGYGYTVKGSLLWAGGFMAERRRGRMSLLITTGGLLRTRYTAWPPALRSSIRPDADQEGGHVASGSANRSAMRASSGSSAGGASTISRITWGII